MWGLTRTTWSSFLIGPKLARVAVGGGGQVSKSFSTANLMFGCQSDDAFPEKGQHETWRGRQQLVDGILNCGKSLGVSSRTLVGTNILSRLNGWPSQGSTLLPPWTGCRAYHGGSNTILSRIVEIASASSSSLLLNQPSIIHNSQRGVTKFSLLKGRRKTNKEAISRYYRLDWGAWINTKPGRARHLWEKSAQQRRRLKQHLFSKTFQCRTLDRMMTKYWIKKKHFVDDPYESYHTRDYFPYSKGVSGLNSTLMYRIQKYVHPKYKKSKFE